MDSVMDEGYKAGGNAKSGANMQGSKASANSKKGGKQNRVIDLSKLADRHIGGQHNSQGTSVIDQYLQ